MKCRHQKQHEIGVTPATTSELLGHEFDNTKTRTGMGLLGRVVPELQAVNGTAAVEGAEHTSDRLWWLSYGTDYTATRQKTKEVLYRGFLLRRVVLVSLRTCCSVELF